MDKFIDSKPCKVCHKTKPLTEFSKDSQLKSGIKNHCKVCDKKINKKNYYQKKGRQLKGFNWQDFKSLSSTLEDEFDGLYGNSDIKVKGKLVMRKGQILDEEWYKSKLYQLKKGRKG